MTRTLLFVALVVLSAGCPLRGGVTETSGSIASEPRAEDVERIRALEAETKRLKALLRTADSTSENPIDAPPPPPPEGIGDASALRDEGRTEEALSVGLAALDDLNEAGVDAPRLAAMLGEWALEAGEGALAERLFGEAAAGAEAMDGLADEARTRRAVAAVAALGPDAMAFAEAQALRDNGDLGAGLKALEALIEAGEDAAVVQQAEERRDAWRAEASDLAMERLDRADVLLGGVGPWDSVEELLNSVESLPEGTWDVAEVRRLRAWYRARNKEAGSADVAEEKARLQELLAAARGHVAGERYREAVAAYRELEGTSLQTTARDESRSAMDTLVKAERERAGRLFTAARKKPDEELRKAALAEVAALLRSLLSEFPESSYAPRVADNLAVVEKELAKGS